MRVMVFIDFDNFKANIRCIDNERGQNWIIDFHKINGFVIDYLKGNPQYQSEKLIHIRTYFYTGEYTTALINKIKNFSESSTGTKKKQIEKFYEERK